MYTPVLYIVNSLVYSVVYTLVNTPLLLISLMFISHVLLLNNGCNVYSYYSFLAMK